MRKNMNKECFCDDLNFVCSKFYCNSVLKLISVFLPINKNIKKKYYSMLFKLYIPFPSLRHESTGLNGVMPQPHRKAVRNSTHIIRFLEIN